MLPLLSEKEKMKKYQEMYQILSDVQADRNVRKMKKYMQHGNVSTYEHCENVAKLSYNIDRLLSLRSDLRVLLLGAMLHDFYLYDWHKKDHGAHRLHGFRHARTACLNAKKFYHVDERISHVIYCHMWPLNPERIPMSREAWIVCIADKAVSFYETLFRR